MFIFRIALIAALGGFLFGFDTAVISGTTESLKALFDLSDNQLGFTVASALIGTIVGAMFAGRLTERFGRRSMLVVMAALYFVSALGCAYAWNWPSFLIFRFIGGLGVGGASVVSPMYIAEISPAAKRGKLVAMQQFNIVFGILIAYVSNYIIASYQLGATEWRWMFGVEALPAAIFFILLFTIPRSPRWLIAKGRRVEAQEVLLKLEPDVAEATNRLAEIEASYQKQIGQPKERLFQKKYTKVMLMAVAITAFNQLSGINAVIYYAPTIFKLTGAGASTALLSSIGIGIVNLIFTMLALAVIDKMGRKKLMLLGSIGYLVSLGAIALTFNKAGDDFNVAAKALAVSGLAEGVIAAPDDTELAKKYDDASKAFVQSTAAVGYAGEPVNQAALASPVAVKSAADDAFNTASASAAGPGKLVMFGLFLFIAAHAFGQGAVVWVFVSEIFPNAVRDTGLALGSFSIWVFAAIVGQLFPTVVGALGGATTFALFFGFMVLQLIWVLKIMPETKGVPLEDMEKELGLN